MKIDNQRETRVRQYANTYKGEIVVFIHSESDKGINSRKIYEQIFKNYKYVSQVTLVNVHKIKVVFDESANKNNDASGATNSKISDREKAVKEANELARSKIGNCHVYIPANFSEVQGVISWPIGQETQDFVSEGKGKFNSVLIREVQVLEALRLKRKASDDTLEDTSIVIITFEGNLLPNRLQIENMLIPVREYRRREMFCENCKKYSHTKKFCNNKKLEKPAYLCVQCQSNDHIGGSNQCPRRKVLERKHAQTLKKLRQRTYAEMLKELDPAGEAHETPDNVTIAPFSFPSRKEEVAAKNQAMKASTSAPKTPSVPKQQSQVLPNKYPPGFQKKPPNPPKEEPDEFSKSLIEFLQSVMNDLNVPAALQDIICNYATPYITRFLQKLTDTITNKLLNY